MEVLLASIGETKTLVAGGVLVALLVAESLHPFFEHFEAVSRERGAHLLRNLAMGALNSTVVAVFFVGLWLAAAVWAADRGVGLLNWLSSLGIPTWLHVAGAVVILDAWSYVWHRLNHEVPLLWRFHRVHHSDNRLDVTTASRFHVGEIVLSSALRIPIIVLAGVYVWELVLYETLMFAVVQFHHANLGLPPAVDRALRALIVSPDMHKVHHSRHQPETDSNYASVFSFWDRLGRTFRMRDDFAGFRPGLDGFDDEEAFQSLRGMLATPLRGPDEAGDGAGEGGASSPASEVGEHGGPVTPDMKVAEVVERHPGTVDVFRGHDCPDMRSGFFHLMARLMSVRAAAAVHRIELDRLVHDLNRAAGEEEEREGRATAGTHARRGSIDIREPRERG